ncbi:MAG: hypothetical protein LBH01_03445 [Verrucomicrobiales bacterium]|nr:hypothetical protein [Verrucomicrobiales bacterium]
MKRKIAFLAMVGYCAFTGQLIASTLTWDPSGNGTGSDGGGTWDNTVTNTSWASGGSDIYYQSGTLLNTNSAVAISGTVLTFANTSAIKVGQSIVGTGVPFGATVVAIDGNNVTISAALTAASNSGQGYTFSAGDVIVGSGNGAAGIINVTGNQYVASLTINAAGSGNYTFSGGTITLGSNGNGYFKVNSSVVFNTVVNAANTNGAGNVILAGGVTLTLNNGGGIMAGDFKGIDASNALTAKVVVGGTTTLGNGTFNIGNANDGTGGLWLQNASLTYGGGMQLAQAGTGYVNIGNGSSLNITGGSGQLSIGRNATNNVGRMDIDGGTLNIASSSVLPVFIGRGAGTGILNLNSGTFNVSATRLAIAHDNGSKGTVNINGGVATIKEIQFSGAANDNSGSATTGTGSLNLNGGSLYVGSGGITNKGTGTAKYFITLASGTLGAYEDWSSSLNMTANGVEIKAADTNGVSHQITLSGSVTGSGFTKTGGGTLLLSGVSNLTGTVLISAGTLQIGTGGALTVGTLDFVLNGTGNGVLDLNGGTLSLTNISIDTTNAATSGSWTLYGVDEAALLSGVTVSGWSSEGGGLWTNGNYQFDATQGIVTAIPEPSTWLLLAVGFGIFAVNALKRRHLLKV